METAFTVDLSTVVTNINSHADQADRVARRVAALIKPGVTYSLVDADGEAIGVISNEFAHLNLDEKVYDNGNYEPEYCDTEEALDELLENYDVAEAILNLVTHPAEQSWGGGDSVQAQRSFIAEQRDLAEDRRKEIRAELQEEISNPNCSGYLDTLSGEVAHRSGARCNVHQINIT